jgi:hypothetical protein
LNNYFNRSCMPLLLNYWQPLYLSCPPKKLVDTTVISMFFTTPLSQLFESLTWLHVKLSFLLFSDTSLFCIHEILQFNISLWKLYASIETRETLSTSNKIMLVSRIFNKVWVSLQFLCWYRI